MTNIEGRNPVIEALKADRKIKEILLLNSARGEAVDEIYQLAGEKGIHIEHVSRKKLDQEADSHSHQGVIAKATPREYWKLDKLIKKAKQESKHPLIILLDELKDPHNLGAVLRTAEAAGADGVVIPKRRSVGFTPVVAKASAGAVEYMPVARVTNLARSIDKLKEAGFWITGADLEGERFYHEADLTGAVGLVIGSEGEGIRRLVKEKCDFVVKLPMEGKINSLNASVAAGILIYEARRQQTDDEG